MKSAIITALALILIGIASTIAKAESSRRESGFVTHREAKSRMTPSNLTWTMGTGEN